MSEKKKEKLDKAGMLIFPFNYEDAKTVNGAAEMFKKIVPLYEVAKESLSDPEKYGGYIGRANIFIQHDAASTLTAAWSSEFPEMIAHSHKYLAFDTSCYLADNFDETKQGAFKAANQMATLIRKITNHAALLGNSLGTELAALCQTIDDDDFSVLTTHASEELKNWDSAIVVVQEGEYHTDIDINSTASFLHAVEQSIGFRPKICGEWTEEDEDEHEKKLKDEPGKSIKVKVIKPEDK